MGSPYDRPFRLLFQCFWALARHSKIRRAVRLSDSGLIRGDDDHPPDGGGPKRLNRKHVAAGGVHGLYCLGDRVAARVAVVRADIVAAEQRGGVVRRLHQR